MAKTAKLEILCKACKQTALARREPVYDGFRKIGEAFVCTACGHRYDSFDATPFVDNKSGIEVFSDEDKPDMVQVFGEHERRRSCGWCAHFIMNPFYQRCGLDNREKEATDLCDRFEPKKEAEPEKPAPDKSAFDQLFGNQVHDHQ